VAAVRASGVPGPSSGNFGVVLAALPAPTVTAAAWDGGLLRIEWSAARTLGLSGYRVVVTPGGSLPRPPSLTFECGPETGLAVATSLDATQSWLVQVASVRVDGAVGPFGGAVPVVLPPAPGKPVVDAAAWDGNVLRVQWSPAANTNPTGYRVTILGSTLPPIRTGPDTVLAMPALLPPGSYQAKVTAFGAGGPSLDSDPVAVVMPALTKPVIESARYDGALLHLSWSGTAEAGLRGYRVSLADSGGNAIGTWDTGPEGSLTVATVLNPALSCMLTVVALGFAGAVGTASDAVTLVTTAPVISSLTSNGSSAQAVFAGPVPDASLYWLGLFDDASMVAFAPAAAAGGAIVLPAGGSRYGVRAWAGNATALGPLGGAAELVTGTPSLVALSCTADSVTVAWQAVACPAVTGYAIAIGAAAVERRYAVGDAHHFTAPLAFVGADMPVSVQAVGPDSAGPLATGTLLPAPPIDSVTYDGTTLTVTFHQVLGPGVTAYLLDVLADATSIAGTVTPAVESSPTATVALAIALPQDRLVTVTVAGIGATAATPPSTPFVVLAVVPQISRCFYDGQTLRLAWSATSQPGQTSYRVDITGGLVVLPPVFKTAPTLDLAVALVAGTAYQITVRAACQSMPTVSVGPASQAVDPLSGPLTYFFGASTSEPAFLYPSLARPPATGGLITLWLPNIGAFDVGIRVDPFVLTRVAGSGPLPYRLDIGGTGTTIDPWQMALPPYPGTQIRKALADATIALLRALAPGRPGAVAVVRRALAAALPQTFEETMFYRYGLMGTAPYVDLLPGMRVRIDSEAFQVVLPESDMRNGFAPGSSGFHQLSSLPLTDRMKAATFAPFLSRLTGLKVTADAGGGYGGVVDLYQPSGPRNYFRLFYPPTFTSPTDPGPTDVSSAVALVGALDWAVLQDQTDYWALSGQFNPALATLLAYFRGRVTVTPMIDVVLDGTPLSVELGTTVRQLLERFMPLPYGETLQLNGFHLERAISELASSADAFDQGYQIGRTAPVSFQDFPFTPYPSGTDWFDLPLRGGDRLSLNAGG
jgi:hypothetical protein